MEKISFREEIVERLRQDLIGPSSTDELLEDRPSQVYSTGILYPRLKQLQDEDDEDSDVPVEPSEDTPGVSVMDGVALHSTFKPSSAGLSFAVSQRPGGDEPCIDVEITCGSYRQLSVNKSGQLEETRPRSKKHERWQRTAHQASMYVTLTRGVQRVNLDENGIPGLQLYVVVRPHRDLLTVTVALSNSQSRGDSSEYDEAQHYFQVGMRIHPYEETEFVPRPPRKHAAREKDMRVAELIYRKNREYCVGHTCSATTTRHGELRVTEVATTWIPAEEVHGVNEKGDESFSALYTNKELRPLDASWLARADRDELAAALRYVPNAYDEWISKENHKREALTPHLASLASDQIELCKVGQARINEGIEVIEKRDKVRTAFQLANAAMAKQFAWGDPETPLLWRPFQLAFQLLVLPSLVDRSHADRETMDLLWFPTGGGKTEAYLALIAFTIFYRRLEANGAPEGNGVAAFMRYTLRLLTVQQFQRATAVIAACELIRIDQNRRGGTTVRLGAAPISLGLWVGGAATPLKLKEAVSKSEIGERPYAQVTHCPACGKKLKWQVSLQASKVVCRSDSSECEIAANGRVVPIWTIDEEIYRESPSLVIATIDKFAQIVRNPETSALFGKRTNSAPPDLIIQDELHLISGPLGSIAGLYETAIDELCQTPNSIPKIIGSTATIRRASEQSKGLFNRDTYQFPSPGIDAENSGFAVTDYSNPGRLYLGISTAGRSATYMLQAIAASLLQAASQSPVDDVELADAYWTLVVYFNSLRELGRGAALMQDDVIASIRQIASRRSEREREIKAPAELTSRVPSDEIRNMLARLSRRYGDRDAEDMVMASNMISVGMDIPRLGMMLVNAQPKSMSEYIQATSRVGRGTVPGIVVTMYNATRARDQSHYETFETWHRSLYKDIEPSSVTPFASRAQDKALHAVLVALVRHTVPGMLDSPVLTQERIPSVMRIADRIVQRASGIDQSEAESVSAKLEKLIQEWKERDDLETYWDDYGKSSSLLMSAEQYTAKVQGVSDRNLEGRAPALWPTPNSMREVEAATPFVLKSRLDVGNESQ